MHRLVKTLSQGITTAGQILPPTIAIQHSCPAAIAVRAPLLLLLLLLLLAVPV
jgi:hypothetical protein